MKVSKESLFEYFEGNLTPLEESKMLDNVIADPDTEREFNRWSKSHISSTNMVYGSKAQLIKPWHAGFWPKAAIGTAVVCLAFVGVMISNLNQEKSIGKKVNWTMTKPTKVIVQTSPIAESTPSFAAIQSTEPMQTVAPMEKTIVAEEPKESQVTPIVVAEPEDRVVVANSTTTEQAVVSQETVEQIPASIVEEPQPDIQKSVTQKDHSKTVSKKKKKLPLRAKTEILKHNLRRLKWEDTPVVPIEGF